MDREEKNREQRLRGQLARMGYTLRKSRVRVPEVLGYGGYIIVDTQQSFVVAGTNPDFSFTLDDVEAWINEP
jgi:hypothetical protein